MAPATTSTTGGSGGPAQGGGEYRWSTLPSIGSQVQGCHLVPMKAPHAEGESGGLTMKQVKATCPGVVKVISLVNLDKKEVCKGGPKMYTREEVYGEGLLLGEVMCKPVGHPWDSGKWNREWKSSWNILLIWVQVFWVQTVTLTIFKLIHRKAIACIKSP